MSDHSRISTIPEITTMEPFFMASDILVVDDDIITLKIAANRLGKLGFSVKTVDSGDAAIDHLKVYSCRLILLDQVMTGMDGITTYEKIREIHPFIPVIMTTAHGSMHLCVEFLKRGGKDFIEKPLDFSILNIKINHILKHAAFEQKVREAEIEKKAFKEAEHLKYIIAASASHELKTPLNFIRGISLSLQGKLTGSFEDDLFQESISQIEDIRKALSILSTGINDLLEIALLEKGHEVSNDIVAVEPLVDEILIEAQNKAYSKGLTQIVKDMDDTLPPLVTDRKKLKRALANILDNAVKYTDMGTISIAATHKNDHIVIAVNDTGIGMSKPVKDSILRSFPGSLGPSPGSPISGVGLYISRKLIDLLQGQIRLESQENEGTSVYITFPSPESPLQ